MHVHSCVYFKPKLTFLTREPLLTLHCSNHSERPYHEERKTSFLDDGNVRTLKSLARKRTRAGKIAKTLKRTEGATRQKAFSLGVSLDAPGLVSEGTRELIERGAVAAPLFFWRSQ
jgi:hypothetical protein